jgi:hypothetical protein
MELDKRLPTIALQPFPVILLERLVFGLLLVNSLKLSFLRLRSMVLGHGMFFYPPLLPKKNPNPNQEYLTPYIPDERCRRGVGGGRKQDVHVHSRTREEIIPRVLP